VSAALGVSGPNIGEQRSAPADAPALAVGLLALSPVLDYVCSHQIWRQGAARAGGHRVRLLRLRVLSRPRKQSSTMGRRVLNAA
jgi:hypothetical protein